VLAMLRNLPELYGYFDVVADVDLMTRPASPTSPSRSGVEGPKTTETLRPSRAEALLAPTPDNVSPHETSKAH